MTNQMSSRPSARSRGSTSDLTGVVSMKLADLGPWAVWVIQFVNPIVITGPRQGVCLLVCGVCFLYLRPPSSPPPLFCKPFTFY